MAIWSTPGDRLYQVFTRILEQIEYKMKAYAEGAMIGAALIIIIVYNGLLALITARNPNATRHGVNQAARRIWVLEVIKSKRDILAVQTLRNSMMASTLLASTSLTLSSLVAAYLYRLGDESGMWSWMSASGDNINPVIKLFALLCCYIMSFTAFMQSLRGSSTASFLVSLGPQVEGSCPERCAEIVQRSALFYSIGSRAFVGSFVFVLWVIGPVPALVGAILLTVVHVSTDFKWGMDKGDIEFNREDLEAPGPSTNPVK